MARCLTLLSAAWLVGIAGAQQVGKQTPEVHPSLTTWECTVKGGCTQKNTSVVIDSDYRWLHTVNGTKNCKGAGLDASLCPDAKTCAQNCALEGVDYAGTGIHTKGGELSLSLYTNRSGFVTMSSPRVYLLANETQYKSFSMLDKEIAFDVDVSKLPCGSNGALYFSEMAATGGRSKLNPAGATYGTGYCDAQCPSPPFINGEANIDKRGACCNEMDLWEANRAATALTPHPCNITGVYQCEGALCGNADRFAGVCDKDGCDFNPYRLGHHSFYQQNGTSVDTSRPFTVVTQFITAKTNSTAAKNSTAVAPVGKNSTSAAGQLSEIRRLYVQDGKVIENTVAKVEGLPESDSLTDAFCQKEKDVFKSPNAFAAQGGMAGMGEALRRGMVLVFSIWNDAGGEMEWLDGTVRGAGNSTALSPGAERGPCKAGAGKAADMVKTAPWTQVKFSNVKTGEIGSTYKKGA